MNLPAVYNALAEMRRSFARFQIEVNEYMIAAANNEYGDMDHSRGLAHASLDIYLDHVAKANEKVSPK